MERKIEYGSRWLEYDFIPLGGFWTVVVGIIEDNNTGARKIRIAKGKVKGKVHRVGNKLEYILDNKEDPVTQINRLNIKKKSEWNRIKKSVEKHISKLDEIEESPEENLIIRTKK